MSIEIPERAQWDIEIAADEIRQWAGVRAADRFAVRLHRTLTTLERFPRLGQLIEPHYPSYPDLRVMSIRQQPHHLVYFVPLTDGIRVVRVLHSSQDADAIFG